MARATLGRWVALAVLFTAVGAAPLIAQTPQETTISGRVIGDQGQPLAGANVFIPSLNIGTNTNTNGNYTLTVPARGQTVPLTARFIGYAPVSRPVTLTPGTQRQEFTLRFDPVKLNEVVVTGTSAAVSAKSVPFAIGTVSADQLQDTPATSPLGGLSGKVAGAKVTTGNGAPGSAPTVKLRAATSLTSKGTSTCTAMAGTNSCGSSEPLVLIDGTITRLTLADISSEDIERIEVLKGAAASSLYGSDAANGVIQIFTKRGANLPEDKVAVTLRNEYGQSRIGKLIPRAEAHSWKVDANGDYLRTVCGNDDPTSCPRIPEEDGIADNPYKRVFNPQEEALQPGQFVTNYLSIGQRRGSTNYNASFQNTRTEGVIFGLQGFSRQNFRLNLDQTVNPKLDLSVSAFYGKSNNDETSQGPGSPFFSLTFVEPDVNLQAKNPDSTPYRAQIPDRVANASNPLYALANTDINTARTRFTGTVRGRYRIFDWLTGEGNYNYDVGQNALKSVTPFGFRDASGNPTDGSLQRQQTNARALNSGLTLTAVRSFGMVANTTRASYVFEDQESDLFDLFAGALTVQRTPEFTAADNAQLTPGSRKEIIRNRNYFLVSTFDIKDRYIVDGLIRRDQSSLFGPENRSADYYRISGAWRANEDLDLPGVDELKLRASRGTAGLRPTFEAQYEQLAIQGGAPEKRELGNQLLKPAHSTENELGFNLDFLTRYRLEYTFAYKSTKDQILLLPLSAATGFKRKWANAGTLEGRTHEASFNALLAARERFQWRIGITGDRTRQKITELAVQPYLVGPSYQGSDETTQIFRIAAGETFGVIYGARTVRGINQLYDDPAKQALSGPGQRWSRDSVMVNEEGYVVRKSGYGTTDERPIKYVNKQGKDIVQIGDVNPDFNMGFTTSMSYRGFSVSGLIDWVKGGNIYNGTRQWPFFENRDRVYDQRGKPESAKKPQQYYNFFYNSIDPIDFFVEKGTYVKLKELAVNYSIPTTLVSRMRIGGVERMRVGIVGRNLFTSTKYSGYDPEVSGLSGDPYSFRFDGFSYPNFRSFTGVLEIDF